MNNNNEHKSMNDEVKRASRKSIMIDGKPMFTIDEFLDFIGKLDRIIRGKENFTEDLYKEIIEKHEYVKKGLTEKFEREPALEDKNKDRVKEMEEKIEAITLIHEKGYDKAIQEIEKNPIIIRERNERIESGETVYFSDIDQVHTAQGFTRGRMWITIPLAYDKLITDKGGNIVGTKKAVGNFAISSKKEIRSPTSKLFEEMGIMAEFPESIAKPRWRKKSIYAFLHSEVDIEPKNIFRRLKEIWEYYMDFSGNKGVYTFLPLIDTLSYCIWLFDYAPYIKYGGEKGASKSKACQIHENIDFNAIARIDPTPAVIFRILQDTKGTMIIDEAESYDKGNNKSEKDQAIEGIINGGFKKNGVVSRMEKINGKQTALDYSVFGIKIIGSINSVSETIRDRSYHIMLTKTLNGEIGKRTPTNDNLEFLEIRDDLYTMIMSYWQEIQKIKESVEIENKLGLIGREWDKAWPILVIAEFYARHDPENRENIFSDIWAFLEDQKEKEMTQSIDTYDELVISTLERAIVSRLAEEGKPSNSTDEEILELASISDEIAVLENKKEIRSYNPRNYSRYVRQKIERLGLGKDFRHGSQNKTVFTSSNILIDEAKKRYSIRTSDEDFTDSNNSINLINSINLNNSINSINTIINQLELIEVKRNYELVNSINLLQITETTAHLESRVKRLNELIEFVRNIQYQYAEIQKYRSRDGHENPQEGESKDNNTPKPEDYLTISRAVVETIVSDPKWKRGAVVDPQSILSGLLKYHANITLSLSDLNEKILPMMAMDNVIHLTNGKVILTGKNFKDLKKDPGFVRGGDRE